MKPDDAKVWMQYSESDLRAAKTLFESRDFFPVQICFLSQQCAEKALKAVLVFEDVYFPKIHDLDRLRDLIPEGWKAKEQFPDLAELTIWAVESRYPGLTPNVTEKEAADALQLAEAVFEAVATELRERM